MNLPPLPFWHGLADAADRETMSRFRGDGAVANKLERGFDPVTEADQRAERVIRSKIEARYPDHAILGEEYGASQRNARFRWVIDPIDGTRSFVAGLATWMTLIGLERDGRAVAGLASQPVTRERFVALGDGRAFVQRDGRCLGLATRKTGRPETAIVMTTDPFILYDDVAKLDRFRAEAQLVRYGADAYAFCALAAGTVDVVFERGVQPHDVSALIPIIEAAGGLFTSWKGERPEAGGNVVAAATPALHEWALSILA